MGLGQDVRFALRGFRRNPGFTAVAVIVLALGIGANTAIFSVVDAVVLRPLPYARPQELVVVGKGSQPGRPGRGSASWPMLRDWRAQSGALKDLAAYRGDLAVLTGAGSPELLEAIVTTANLFDVLGVPPALGRGFAPGEDQPGRNRVAILSDGLWRRRFAADPQVLGRTVTFGGAPYTVVGVAARGFRFPPTEHAGEVWLPAPYGPRDAAELPRRMTPLQVVGRLAEGVSLDQAQAELRALHARLARQYPEDGEGGVLTAAALQADLVRNVKPALLTLFVAVACVLLIACANVSNLLLARATTRRHELAVRVALGAGPGRIVRQLLTECAVLGLAGGVLGAGLAVWGLDVLLALLPDSLPRPQDISVDGRVMVFTLAVAITASVVCGMVPALSSARSDLQGAVGQSARTVLGRGRARAALLVAEIALSFLLLVGAGLALRSFLRLTDVDPGFQARGLLTADIGLPEERYDAERTTALYRQVLGRVQAMPGVEGAALVLPVPYSRSTINPHFIIPGRPAPGDGRRQASARFVSPEYFRVMSVRLLGGRLLEPSDDRPGAAPVLVVSESLAREHFPGEEAVGKSIELGGPRRIVGVVSDVKPRLDAPPRAEVYMPFANPFVPIPLRTRTVLVRTSQPTRLLGPLRAEVERQDRNLPVGEVKTMEQRLRESLQQRRSSVLLLAFFGVLALVLAAAGIYGVMSYNVSQRHRELGVRMALGARSAEVVRMILGQGLRLSLVGLALGVVAALALTRVLASQLYGISTTDPVTFAALAALLLAVATLAAFIPARRATRIDPMVALRSE